MQKSPQLSTKPGDWLAMVFMMNIFQEKGPAFPNFQKSSTANPMPAATLPGPSWGLRHRLSFRTGFKMLTALTNGGLTMSSKKMKI
jgi:hypothetical protein